MTVDSGGASVQPNVPPPPDESASGAAPAVSAPLPTAAVDAGNAAPPVDTQQAQVQSASTHSNSPILKGVWNESLAEKLKANMERPWEPKNPLLLDKRMGELYNISVASYPLHKGSAVREMTPQEKEAPMEYLQGRLPLSRPPSFVDSTVTAARRVMLMAFHERHIESTLAATAPASVHLGKHIMHRSILRMLVLADTDKR